METGRAGEGDGASNRSELLPSDYHIRCIVVSGKQAGGGTALNAVFGPSAVTLAKKIGCL